MPPRRSDSRLHRGRQLDTALRADPRNERYPMAARFGAGVEIPLSSKVWACPTVLDQGSEGACVGFAAAHYYGSEQRIQKISTRIARTLYQGAQKHDEWPGENYSGTSVNGLMAYLHAQGLIGRYDWIYTFDELARTLALHGPVIWASEWREGSFQPDATGTITAQGSSQGGHCVCMRGINFEQQYILIQQSWGRSHGLNGSVKMHFDDVRALLRTRPQIAFPEKRSLHPLTKSTPWWQFWK